MLIHLKNQLTLTKCLLDERSIGHRAISQTREVRLKIESWFFTDDFERSCQNGRVPTRLLVRRLDGINIA
jgi:hypothetical protein